jgi:hypothetical protein
MIRPTNSTLIAAAVTALICGAALPVLANGMHGARGGGPNGPGRPAPGFGHYGRLIDQLLNPCRSDCLEAAHTCQEAAAATALACAETTCDDEIQDARTACTADRTSQACKDAVTALRTCIDPCVDDQATATAACRDTLRTCLSACAGATPTPTE